ncbi:MAG: TRAP transporter large permease [Geminicoccaceae bacterium]
MLALLFGSLLVLLLLGVPVFAALGISSLLYIVLAGIPPMIVVQQMFNGIDKFSLLAVPFFILAGILMNAARITDELFTFARSLVGHLRGGLGHVNIVASVIFSGMSGTAVADAGGLGTVEIKAMRDQGYPERFAVGITAASSTIGPIIPPSLSMIVYGVVANASIGQLFAAGIVPGILMALALHVMVWYLAWRHDYPRERRAGLRRIATTFLSSLPALVAPVIIIGGIVTGVVTPTEAAAVAVIYALLVGVFWYRALGAGAIVRALFETFETTAVVMLMVSASAAFGWILVRENIAAGFTQAIVTLAGDPWQAMLLLNLILLFAGMFMETVAIILILTPIMIPVLDTYGIDHVQFGVIMVLNLMIGLLTPPIGLLLFVMARIARMDLMSVTAACAPFMIPLIIVLVLISLFPALTLTVPGWFFDH